MLYFVATEAQELSLSTSLSILKSNSDLPKKKMFISFNDNSSKTMKNAFCLILKALFVLKMFKTLSWLFGDLEKRLD